MESLVQQVLGAFDAALGAAAPEAAMSPALDGLEGEPSAILAIGKAASSMAQACRDKGFSDSRGLIVTNPEHAVPVEGFELILGGHPVPDEGSIAGADAAIRFVQGLGHSDHLLVLLSGGGSSLMVKPIGDLTLRHKRMVNEVLLASGMDIHRMNAVRRLFSAVKGGRLAVLASPARVTQWVLSDVPGDHLASIASGPFAADHWSLDDAIDCVREAGIDRHGWAVKTLAGIRDGVLAAPVRPGNEAVERVDSRILASNEVCVAAAAEKLGGKVRRLPELAGDAVSMGRLLAEFVKTADHPLRAVTGGETVVVLPERYGLGGRSQALALSFMLMMQGAAFDWVLLAGGTDGRDGPTDAAGGLVDSSMDIDPVEASDALERHDSHRYLDRVGGLLRCRPTGTNLGDVAIVATAIRA